MIKKIIKTALIITAIIVFHTIITLIIFIRNEIKIVGFITDEKYKIDTCYNYFFNKSSFSTYNRSRLYITNGENGRNNFFLFLDCPMDSNFNVKKRVVIIGLDDFDYYNPDKVIIHERNFKEGRIKSSNEDNKLRIKIKSLYPFLPFATRLFPEGKNLEVFGVKNTDQIKNIEDGKNEIKIIESELEKIYFVVTPNKGLIKNIPISFQFFSKKYGLLAFVKNSKEQTILIIHYIDGIKTHEEYQPFKKEFLKELEAFKIMEVMFQSKKDNDNVK